MKNLSALVVFAMIVAPTRLVPAPAEKDDPPEYYPLKAGTKWHYRGTVGEQKPIEVVNHVAKIEKIDDQQLARLESSFNGKVATTEHLASTSKGIFRHRINGLEASPPMCLLRHPVKKDDSWNGEFKVGEEKGKVTGKVVDDNEEVEVPAGKFKCVRVQLEAETGDQKITTTYWFAKNVGMVKQTAEFVGKFSLTLELEKMETAK